MPARILLVEDNPADVYLIEEALRAGQISFALEWVPDGEQALELFDEIGRTAQRPDLILLDLNLPRVDGKEVLSRARQNQKLANTVIAILTSSDSASDRRDTEALGANCYIKKPPTLDEFLCIGQVIRDLLDAHSIC